MKNTNRINILSMLGGSVTGVTFLTFNLFGNDGFREVMFFVQGIIAVIGLFVATGAAEKCFKLWYLEELRTELFSKGFMAVYILVLHAFFLFLLFIWYLTKSYAQIDVYDDQMWIIIQFTWLMMFLAGCMDTVIDVESLLDVRLSSHLDVPKFGEIAIKNEYISRDHHDKIIQKQKQMMEDFDA